MLAPSLLLLLPLPQSPEAPEVLLVRVPEEELQPQVEVDGDGIAHLLTFAGDVGDGELRYRTSEDGGDTWASPLAVSADVVARDRVRGGRMALGREGWVHVAWTSSTPGRPLAYSRLGLGQEAFEPARGVVGETLDLGAGCAIAADGSGGVWVAWSDAPGGDETQGLVWIARSTDDGASFAPARAAWSEPTGACSACAPAIATDGDALYVLYRGAGAELEHGAWLLVSRDGGASFTGRALDSWRTRQCPPSGAALRPGPLGMVGVWERANALTITSFRGLEAVETDRKFRRVGRNVGLWQFNASTQLIHPVLAFDTWGDLLLVALSDAPQERGPRLDWSAYDADGEWLGAAPRPLEQVPAHSFATAFARTDGAFVVLY